MKTALGNNDDYAVVNATGDKPWNVDEAQPMFYYGYEHLSVNKEWCFIVKMGKKVIFLRTKTELEESCSDDLIEPISYLVQGMYLYFTRPKP